MKINFTLILLVLSFYFAGCSSSGSSNDVYLDSRDGQSYRTIQIGNLIWMLDNLNYKNKGSSCYDDINADCNTYGKLYTWEAAQDAVPQGWRLPTLSELKSLIEYFKAESKPDILTVDYPRGFNVLYGGSKYYYGEYHGIGEYAVFWSSTESDSAKVYCFSLDKEGNNRITYPDYLKTAGFSVRCIKKASFY